MKRLKINIKKKHVSAEKKLVTRPFAAISGRQ